MIKSKFFWIGAILLATTPLLLIDVTKHALSWKTEVHDEMIYAVQNTYNFTVQQKADILDRILESNKTLMAAMCIKSFISIIFFVLSLYFFRLFAKTEKTNFMKPLITCIALVVCFVLVKVLLLPKLYQDEKVKFVELQHDEDNLNNLYHTNFNGKVVYVDFWGTTCGPCLEEFRNFTKPLKDKYKLKNDIAYLYVSQGNRYLWKQQIERYNIEGTHLFLNNNQYDKLYKQSIRNNKAVVFMPRYLIIDKHGKIVETRAPQPSNVDSISTILNKYLAAN
ncbi:TlpA family protein disulfide reductase [Mucilaginibacter sp.]|uniref:TlpA family protein disulfide reductase n=1 Tax=Mucilaginibacter sp. TaxID=1882438 RepID=UPI003AFF978E